MRQEDVSLFSYFITQYGVIPVVSPNMIYIELFASYNCPSWMFPHEILWCWLMLSKSLHTEVLHPLLEWNICCQTGLCITVEKKIWEQLKIYSISFWKNEKVCLCRNWSKINHSITIYSYKRITAFRHLSVQYPTHRNKAFQGY